MKPRRFTNRLLESFDVLSTRIGTMTLVGTPSSVSLIFFSVGDAEDVVPTSREGRSFIFVALSPVWWKALWAGRTGRTRYSRRRYRD
jgi:hypothetical protein